MADGFSSLVVAVGVAALSVVGLELANAGDLGPGPQSFAQKVAATFGGTGTGAGAGAAAGSGSGAGGGGCTFDSTTLGIPACFGPLWCQTHSAPPASIGDLEAWGNTNKYRDPTSRVWTCPGGS